MSKIFYNCMFFIILLIPQNMSAKSEINNSNQNILEYKIEEMNKKLNDLTNENKSLFSAINKSTSIIDSTTKILNNNNQINDKLLQSTKESYDFLEDMFTYAIGFVILLVIASSVIIKILISNSVENLLSKHLTNKSGEAFIAKIEEWINSKNENLIEELENIKGKYNYLFTDYKVNEEFEFILSQEYQSDSTANLYDVQKYKNIIRRCLNENAYEEVKNELSLIAMEYNGDVKIYTLLGTISFYLDQNDQAVKYLELAKGIQVNDSYICHLLAHIYLKESNEKLAIVNFKQAVEYGSNILDDYLYLGDLYLKSDSLVQSEEILSQSTQISLIDIRIYIGLGYIYYKLGNYARTKEMIEKIQYLSK